MKLMNSYCPILGKRVKLKGEMEENKKNAGRHSAICQNDKKICNGNCEGCSLM